jgi:hypothetical protein
MGHELIKATIIPDIVKMIQEEYHITEDEALARFFKSITYLNYDDEETGLYGQSALYIFSLFNNEQLEQDSRFFKK